MRRTNSPALRAVLTYLPPGSHSEGRGHRRARTWGQAIVSFATLVVILAASVGTATADTVRNNVVANGNDTIKLTGTSPGSTTISYLIENDKLGGSNGCDAIGPSPAVVTINAPPGISVSPKTLTFGGCGVSQSVVFSSSSPGSYGITVRVDDIDGSYDTGAATFALKVVRTNSAPTVNVAGVANGASYERGAVPAAVCNVSDVEDGAKTFTATLGAVSGPLSGYGLGSQTATCNYTDAGGLSAPTASATYAIVDTNPPVLTVPGDMGPEATGASGAVVTYAATAVDAVDPAPSVTCSPASGGTFPLGPTVVSCTAKDVANNTSPASQFTVTVRDTTVPELTLPKDLFAEATGPAGAPVAFSPAPAAYDSVDGFLLPTCVPVSGATFALGTTPVNCEVTDAAKNTSKGGFSVTVTDKTPPTLSLPSNQMLEATGPGGAILAYSATAGDLVDGGVAVVCDYPSGSTFKLGETTVSCGAVDNANNPANGSFKVTVVDTTAPKLTLPDDIVLEATKADGRDVQFFPTATDLVDGEVPVKCTPTSGGTFAVGTTIVSCTAADSRNNASPAGSFSVTITDTTPPAITNVPGDKILEATGPGGAIHIFTTPTAVDIVDGVRPITCDPVSGSTFPLGSTTVTCSASDSRSNASSERFTVKVVDTTPPVVAVPANMDLDATEPNGAPASWSASATDIVDGALPVTCDPASGTTFGFATTKVTCTATDNAGNAADNSFTVSVSDKSAPNVSVPRGQTLEATSPAGAVATWSGVSASDVVDGKIQQVPCKPSSGSTFPLGETKVECTATDKAGNVGRDGFAIIVVDTTPPALTVPGDFSVEATGASGTIVGYSATAKDIVDGDVVPSCDIPSGTMLGLGEHTISCSAVDKAYNPAAGKSFKVTVVDTTGPAITVPAPITEEATSSEGAVVTYSVTAVDLVDGAVDYQCLPASGATFPLGTSAVKCSASDSRGKPGAKSFNVTVKDTTKPTVNVPSDITTFATSAGGAVVTYQATASDQVDTNVKPVCSPASGSIFAPGTTTVSCMATDSSGNPAEPKTFKVTVKFDLTGFFAPVDTNKVLNGMKAGSTVPMKWRIANPNGGYISDLGIVKVGSPAAVDCATGALYDEVTEYSAGASAIKYDVTANQYIYNWQSPKRAGSCYQITINFNGGDYLSAIFQLR